MLNELTIIIPVLNEEKYIPRLLHCIANQHFVGKLQVIVVDGGSGDNTIAEVKKHKDTIENLLVVSTTKGVGHQRNVGAEKARYNYILFIDADTILPSNFLSKLQRRVNNQLRFVLSVILFPDSKNVLDWALVPVVYPIYFLLTLTGPLAPGCLLLTTKNHHRLIKGFREDLPNSEDTDYGIRSVDAGAKWVLMKTLYVRTSARRARQIGRIKLLLGVLKSYIRLKRKVAVASS